MRGSRRRRGVPLILTGLGFLLIGVVLTALSYVSGGRYTGYHTISWWPIVIGVLTMVRGAAQAVADRRAGVSGGPGPGIPGPDGQSGQAPQPGEPPSYDQPGYALPRNQGSPRGPEQQPPA